MVEGIPDGVGGFNETFGAVADVVPYTHVGGWPGDPSWGAVGVTLPFSRVHESEADEIGLFLMVEAGYDPRTAIDVWIRMDEAQDVDVPEFLSTHPAPSSRIEEFRRMMPEAMELYREAEASRRRRGE